MIRDLLEAEVAKDNTLVIHLDDRSTDFLKPIYDGHGYPVISGAVTPGELLAQIEAHSRIYAMGHGSPGGLFARGFMIDDRFGPALAKKPNGLYIWCNADAYAVRNKLSGLVSGMFISEVMEARLFGIQATQQQVDSSNNTFSRLVRELIDGGKPLAEIRQCYASSNPSCQITAFNSERLYTFDNGTPSPALHPTSLGHPQHGYSDYRPTRSNSSDEEEEKEKFGVDPTDEEAFKAWGRELYQAATELDFSLYLLSPREQSLLTELYLDGYSADEALDVLIRDKRDGGKHEPF